VLLRSFFGGRLVFGNLGSGSIGGQTAQTVESETGSVSVSVTVCSGAETVSVAIAVSGAVHFGAIETSVVMASVVVKAGVVVASVVKAGVVVTSVVKAGVMSQTIETGVFVAVGDSGNGGNSDGVSGDANTAGGQHSGASDNTTGKAGKFDTLSLCDVGVGLFDDWLNHLGQRSVGLDHFVDLLDDWAVHVVDSCLGLVLRLGHLDLSGLGGDVLLSDSQWAGLGLEVDSEGRLLGRDIDVLNGCGFARVWHRSVVNSSGDGLNGSVDGSGLMDRHTTSDVHMGHMVVGAIGVGTDTIMTNSRCTGDQSASSVSQSA